MTISTQEPRTHTSRCAICGCEASLSTAQPGLESSCPSCGQLLWWCRQHLADLMEVPAEAITPETELEHDLGADSLDIVELVMEVEEHFDVQVPDEEAVKQMRTVADTVRYIQSQTSRPRSVPR